MTITEHPLVKNYLATVAREAAALSPERRNELLADLEEHIAVALAEESASGDDEVRTVLAHLGDPRTIAATALGEAPPAPRVSRVPIVVIPILLWIIAPQTVFAPPIVVLVLAVALIGTLWWLWTAPQWRNRDKVIGTALALAPLLFWVVQFVVAASGLHLGLGALFIPVGLAALALPTAACVYLIWAGWRRA
ncbi:HAAS signaling domain-containing protein [Streptomyces sioyaensis]|uniref:HAAS signaling domain-containing protein n=1 Tax=Streptomyces sioyaensis TaxID=67364 RepID=UPI0036EEADD9